MKYVLVTGGVVVVSGSGKGVTATSVVLLLKACGLRVSSIKIDPYLNTDPGTDLPHVTDAIQDWIERVAVNPVDGEEGPADVCVIELGGTIGDTKSDLFIEALGQFSYRVGLGNFCLVHSSVVPVLNVVGGRKTKSTQHSVRRLRDLGLTPDILACWSTNALEEHVKEKLAHSCHVPLEHIFTLYDAPNIWHIPLLLKDQKAHLAISKVLNLASILKEPSLREWASRAEICDNLRVPIISQVRTAVVGKYTGLSNAYLSVLKAPLHAYEACRKKLVNYLVPACDLEKETEKENPEAYKAAWKLPKGVYGNRVPGGFGDRGVEGKILAAIYACANKIPFLGICLGMQTAVIEFARSVLCLRDANSTEFKPETKHMEGSMCEGATKSFFNVKDSKSAKQYDNKNSFYERHRHRYEVNPDMVERIEKAGPSLAAKDETGKRMEDVDDLRIPMKEQENCSDYRPKKSQLTRSTIPSKQEVKEDLVKTEKKGNFVTEEAVNLQYIYLINTIIGFFLLLALIFYIISVFLYMAAKFSTNYRVSSPRCNAKSCRSLTDAQTNSNLAPSPVSYPMRIAVSPCKVDQVFLNFRGEQLRYNFVSHLSDAFQKHEIKFFIDKYEQRGKDLKHLFFRIEESSIALAIFSTRYPESSWCMDELVKMKKLEDQGKLRVIPIFYKVEAEDVRKPTGDSEFGKNFWRLAEASSGDQIKNWKEALECISDKMGLSLGDKSSEADFVKEIVKDVQRVIEAIGLEEEKNHGGKIKEKCQELQLSR